MAGGYEAMLAEAESLAERDLPAAESILARAVAGRPDDRRGYMPLLNARLRRSDFAGARAVAAAALARWPGWIEMRRTEAEARLFLGDLRGARDGLAAADRGGGTPRDALNRALIDHALGDHEAALPGLLRALARAAGGDGGPQSQVWAVLARLLRDMGRHALADEAEEATLRFYRARPVWTSSTVSKVVNRRDFPEWDRLRKKDGLARILAAAPEGRRPRHPPSYVMPEDRARLIADAAAGRSGPIWIVKAGDLFGGQGIALTDDAAGIAAASGTVVQHYLDRPLLWDGRKGHLRCYLLITSAAPLRAWFWRDGLVRFAPAAFAPGPGWLGRLDMHITNTALHEGHPGLVFDPDQTVEDRGSVQGLASLVSRLRPDPADAEALWRALEEIARRLLDAVAGAGILDRLAAHGRAFLPKLLGLDLLLDADGRPWLLEVQRVPGQSGPGPVNTINTRLFRTVLEMTVGALGPAAEADAVAAEAAREAAHRGAFVPVAGAVPGSGRAQAA